MKPVRVLAAARKDIDTECRYYNRAQPGLGKRFSLTVAKALRALCENPEAMQNIGQGVRRWPVSDFPHGIMYVITDSEVLVVSVFHSSQDPERLLQRIYPSCRHEQLP